LETRADSELEAGPAATTDAGVAAEEPVERRFDPRGLIGRYAVVLALLAMIVFFSLLRPDTFFTSENFESILVTESVLVVLALGVTIALAAGEFDLSIAAVLGFSAGLLAHLTSDVGWGLMPAMLLTLVAAATVGVLNGIFVVGFGVNSFITTLGMGSVVGGLALAIFGAETIGGLPPDLTDLVRSELFGIGISALFALLLAAALWYFLEHTPGGRHLFFTGEGREAARLAGVRVNRIRFGALVASAVFAWLAAMILAGQTGAAQATYGQPFLLPAFAAGFLGATTIKTGRYNAWGTVIAVYLLAVGTTGLQLLGAEDWVEDVFNGTALVLAVTLSRLVSRER
jgi:ribose transport system permease protein